jgi:photosystem II stability/assembly factor-like uncharacterized protein
MPTGRGDLTVKSFHIYSFLQEASDAAHALQMFSRWGAMGALTLPQSENEPVYRKSLSQREKYELWTTIEGPPGDLPSTSFTEKMPRSSATYLENLVAADRPFTIHTIISETGNPTDPTSWESKEILSRVKLTNLSRDETEGEENSEIEFSADASFESYTRCFPMTFGTEAASDITKEVMGVAVYPPDWRGDSDVKEIYVVQKSDTNPQLIYSKDGGTTWIKEALTEMSTNEPTDICVVGNYVIITSNDGEAYYYTTKDSLDVWTEVTGGFATSKGPNAIWSAGVGEIWMVGDGGYIYKLDVPGQSVSVIDAGSVTAQNLSDIHGMGNTILAVGASNAAVLTQNRGTSWAALTGPDAGQTLNCAHVVDEDALWIGATGLFYSLDAGVTWTEVATGIGSLATIDDIVFCPEQLAVGFVCGTTSTPIGVVKRTTDHGNTWESNSINAAPTNEQINKLAVGGPNYLVAGGLVSAGGADGMLGLAAS